MDAEGRRVPLRSRRAARPSPRSCASAMSAPSTSASPELAIDRARPRDARAAAHLLRRGALRRRRGDLPGCSKRRTRPRASPPSTTSSRATARSSSATARCASPARAQSDLHVDSLEALAATWAGEHYWFWARRVLRKLRHGIRRSGLHGSRLRRRGRDAGGAADGAAAPRQHRHGGARHGQLRPRRSAPHRAARRLAEREGAHRRLRRQLHHRRRRRLSDPRCGDRRLQLAGRHHGAPARPAQAGADPDRGGGGDAPADRRRRALRGAVRARAQRPGDRWRSPTPTR